MAIQYASKAGRSTYLLEVLKLCGCVPKIGWTDIKMHVDATEDSLDTITVTLLIPAGAFEQAALLSKQEE